MAIKRKTPIVEGEQTVFTGDLFEICRRRIRVGDKAFEVEVARRPPGVRLIIVGEQQKLLITREYRTELRAWDYRLPGGKVFDSLSEFTNCKDIDGAVRVAATREAREEAGIVARDIAPYAISHCGATVEWDIHYVVLHIVGAEDSCEQHLELGECIEVGWYSRPEVLRMVVAGQIHEERTAAVLLRFLRSYLGPWEGTS